MLFHLLAGIGICVQPLYLGEVAPKHLRGGMAMGSSIFLTGGILTGQIIGLRLEMHFFSCLVLLVHTEFQFPAALCKTFVVAIVALVNQLHIGLPVRRKPCFCHLIPTNANHLCYLPRGVLSV